jgi:hypothetical protein
LGANVPGLPLRRLAFVAAGAATGLPGGIFGVAATCGLGDRVLVSGLAMLAGLALDVPAAMGLVVLVGLGLSAELCFVLAVDAGSSGAAVLPAMGTK